MSQFARIKTEYIIGHIEDSAKETLTILLSTGECCVFSKETIQETLLEYNEADVVDLFDNIIKNEDEFIFLGCTSVFSRKAAHVAQEATLASKKISKAQKKSKFGC